ncbi:Nascent polypeptide-associated complex subunit alpha, muscle-specific form [Rhizoctonia solani]|uniref:Nascent polypeptide-associated complex subunit alpha, muscle-specific form n=1 Tax=Rhizoctonia solani TaxID=456999 RepID=A0A0K6FM38_9AGAM|nr:Nascent polypeptide-associated complex subunit alpha, muscle-specific form [Rhizoctonia solani]
MPPFSSMLRTKRGRKTRPRTPPSPESFYSPSIAVSPMPWARERANSDAGTIRSNEPVLGRRVAPPSAWTDKSLPRPPHPPRSASREGLQLDLGEGPSRPSHSRQPSGPSTSSPRKAPGMHAPSPLGEPSGSNSSSSLVPPESGPVSVSGSKTSGEIPRRVPSPIKIPRAHVHAPNVTIQRSPSPSSTRPVSNCLSSTSGSCSSPAPSEIPELMTVLRAERASASMLGFTLRVESARLSAFGSVRMDSATLPVEEPPRLEQSTEGLSSGLYPPRPVDRPETEASPARPATVYAIHRISEVPSPLVGSFLDPTTGGSFLPPVRPSSEYSPNLDIPSSSFPPAGASSPLRQRSQTITGERVTGRELYKDAGRQRSASATSPIIERSRSPLRATAATQLSRPGTPDAHMPIPTRSRNLSGSTNSVNGVYTHLATAGPSAGFSSASSQLASSSHLPSSGTISSFDSPLFRSTRLASAPNIPVMGGTAPILSKLTRPPLGFENFSFLTGRGRSGTTTSSSSEIGEAPPPARPARPPSLNLRDDPIDAPRLTHSNSGSSIGSVGLGLRRKRSSPAVYGHERKGSGASIPRKGSDAGIVPAIHRTDSSSGSHRTAGTQQPTPTSPTPALLTLKQRRETVFPTTPRSVEDSPTGRCASDLPGFIVDGNSLMPLKSPAPSTRKAHLPIGPKSVPIVPTRSEPTPVTVPLLPTSTIPKPRPKPAQPPYSKQPLSPPSPTFEPVPVRWRGLTMDAAKWTFSSNQLHNIVSRAIKQSAETSSVRLLPLQVLDQELPVEVERLEQLRDVLQTKYKAQVRRRRLLMRSLALYIDGHDPPTSKRLLDELEDVGVVCDQLAEDLYLVGDQLSQISRLRDVHHTSALAVALRKINQSYIRARSEVVELQAERTSLEAERDEAWLMAESLERELVEAKLSTSDDLKPPSSDESRVSAARRSSIRQSKLSLRRSLRRSARSSTHSGNSMRYHSIVFPRPPTTTTPLFSDTNGSDLLSVPPVPVPPVVTKSLGSLEPSRPESIGVLPSGIYALSPATASSNTHPVVGVPTPSTTSHELYVAQNELLKMLGLSYKEYGFKIRPRSYSDCESVPNSPEAKLSAAPSSFQRSSSARSKLFRSSSDQALRRHSSTVERLIEVEVPAVGGILEDPAAILAALTLPQD